MTWGSNNTPRSSAHRARVVRIKRGNFACAIRGPRCTGRATTSDHIIALGLGGTDTDENSQPACQACNEWKAALEGVSARQRISAGARKRPRPNPIGWGHPPSPGGSDAQR